MAVIDFFIYLVNIPFRFLRFVFYFRFTAILSLLFVACLYLALTWAVPALERVSEDSYRMAARDLAAINRSTQTTNTPIIFNDITINTPLEGADIRGRFESIFINLAKSKIERSATIVPDFQCSEILTNEDVELKAITLCLNNHFPSKEQYGGTRFDMYVPRNIYEQFVGGEFKFSVNLPGSDLYQSHSVYLNNESVEDNFPKGPTKTILKSRYDDEASTEDLVVIRLSSLNNWEFNDINYRIGLTWYTDRAEGNEGRQGYSFTFRKHVWLSYLDYQNFMDEYPVYASETGWRESIASNLAYTNEAESDAIAYSEFEGERPFWLYEKIKINTYFPHAVYLQLSPYNANGNSTYKLMAKKGYPVLSYKSFADFEEYITEKPRGSSCTKGQGLPYCSPDINVKANTTEIVIAVAVVFFPFFLIFLIWELIVFSRNNVKNSNQKLVDQIYKLSEENRSLERKVFILEELKRAHSALKNKNSSLQSQLHESEDIISQLNTKIRTIDEQHNDKVRVLEGEYQDSIRKLEDSYKTEIRDIEIGHKEEIRTIKSAHSDEIARERELKNEMEKEHRVAIENERRIVEAKVDELKAKEIALESQQTTISLLEEKEEMLRASMSAINSEKEELVKGKDALAKRIEVMAESKAKVKKERDAINEQSKEAMKKLTISLQNTLKSKEEMNRSLQQELKSREDVKLLEKQKEAAARELAKRKRKLEEQSRFSEIIKERRDGHDHEFSRVHRKLNRLLNANTPDSETLKANVLLDYLNALGRVTYKISSITGEERDKSPKQSPLYNSRDLLNGVTELFDYANPCVGDTLRKSSKYLELESSDNVVNAYIERAVGKRKTDKVEVFTASFENNMNVLSEEGEYALVLTNLIGNSIDHNFTLHQDKAHVIPSVFEFNERAIKLETPINSPVKIEDLLKPGFSTKTNMDKKVKGQGLSLIVEIVGRENINIKEVERNITVKNGLIGSKTIKQKFLRFEVYFVGR